MRGGEDFESLQRRMFLHGKKNVMICFETIHVTETQSFDSWGSMDARNDALTASDVVESIWLFDHILIDTDRGIVIRRRIASQCEANHRIFLQNCELCGIAWKKLPHPPSQDASAKARLSRWVLFEPFLSHM